MNPELAAVRNLVRIPPGPVGSSLTALDDDQLLARIRLVAQLKRFFERYCADPGFRARLAEEGPAVAADFGIEVSPEDVRAFAAVNPPDGQSRVLAWTDNFGFFRDFMFECVGGLELVHLAGSSSNAKFKAWHERQIARLRFDFSTWGDSIVRPAVALELSKGCSVGCWFCAVSADRLTGNFVYDKGGRRFWREVLDELGSVLGPAASSGFCYWATDPFDNPDYERFTSDFHAALGTFPPTTTALPLKNVGRTRAFLNLSRSSQCRLNRFSVLTLPMLNRIHREFSAEELAFVDLVLQNPGALVVTNFPQAVPAAKVHAGRMLSVTQKAGFQSAPGTIACIVGFLINMVERTIQLVSPCIAGREWPLGYRVHDRQTFSDASELRSAIEQMIDEHMPLEVAPDSVLRFSPGLRYSTFIDGFRLSTSQYAVDFRSRWQFPTCCSYLELGELIRRGDMTADQIRATLEHRGASREQIREFLNLLYERGVLDDSPKQYGEAPQPLLSIRTDSGPLHYSHTSP